MSSCIDCDRNYSGTCPAHPRGPAARPPGRPPQDDAVRVRMIRVRCTEDQEARWRAAADAAGEDLSTWLRELADEASERETR
jgi:hypothetical protein